MRIDRITLGRSILSIEREGLLEIKSTATGRRTREVPSKADKERFPCRKQGLVDDTNWIPATFGPERTLELFAARRSSDKQIWTQQEGDRSCRSLRFMYWKDGMMRRASINSQLQCKSRWSAHWAYRRRISSRSY